jgi:hypothetical protein
MTRQTRIARTAYMNLASRCHESVVLVLEDLTESFPRTLVALGMPLVDNLDLEAVAQETSRGRWKFLVTAAPLAVEHGTGSPLPRWRFF